MPTQYDLYRLDAAKQADVAAAVELWNAACGADLAISERMMRYGLHPSTGGRVDARLAVHDAQPVGFVVVTTLPGEPPVAPQELGWVEALAVHPDTQRQGVGSALLAWAEQWLHDQGCQAAALGAGLRHFVPGVPVELGTAPFFARHGYIGDSLDAPAAEQTWDVACDLARYQTPSSVRAVDAAVRPAQPRDQDALLQFLQREFPGRWRFEFEEHLRGGGRISDYMVLWSERGVDGCCILTFEDSLRPIDHYYPYRLPRPWGQLGAIGISADRRGQGYGALLLDGGLRRLHNNGVNGCVIDWTGLVDFYGKFGFTPYRRYLQLHKPL